MIKGLKHYPIKNDRIRQILTNLHLFNQEHLLAPKEHVGFVVIVFVSSFFFACFREIKERENREFRPQVTVLWCVWVFYVQM